MYIDTCYCTFVSVYMCVSWYIHFLQELCLLGATAVEDRLQKVPGVSMTVCFLEAVQNTTQMNVIDQCKNRCLHCMYTPVNRVAL